MGEMDIGRNGKTIMSYPFHGEFDIVSFSNILDGGGKYRRR
jgi:hypothetical protein